MKSRVSVIVATLVASALHAASGSALPLGFSCITGNLAGDCAIGEAQLVVDVTDLGGGQVLFSFSNAGPAASSITDVYFDDGTLLGIAGLIDADDNALWPFGNPGIDFTQDAAPPELPGESESFVNIVPHLLSPSALALARAQMGR